MVLNFSVYDFFISLWIVEWQILCIILHVGCLNRKKILVFKLLYQSLSAPFDNIASAAFIYFIIIFVFLSIQNYVAYIMYTTSIPLGVNAEYSTQGMYEFWRNSLWCTMLKAGKSNIISVSTTCDMWRLVQRVSGSDWIDRDLIIKGERSINRPLCLEWDLLGL